MSEPRFLFPDRAASDAAAPSHEYRLSLAQRAWGNSAFRKTALILTLGLIWEVYARWLDNPFMLPPLEATLSALADLTVSGVVFERIWVSTKVLLMGYGTGIALAAALTIVASTTRLGQDFLETLTAMFSPLPAIALLPLALLWFGIGNQSMIFVMVHSVLWPVALNTHAGFRAVSPTLRMVGRNYQLRDIAFIARILVPAGFPSILTGLKIGWAFAWRTLIAAELIFGVSSGQGGLGWMIFESRNALDIPGVFAGLLVVILFGLLVENFVFRIIERRTVNRWGTQT